MSYSKKYSLPLFKHSQIYSPMYFFLDSIFLNILSELLSGYFVECKDYVIFLLVISMNSGHDLGRCLINNG